ncbi:lantibiotic dehydratase [Nonomuraea sp. NPDC000554]|uniref:lantibiotic dehydratase n=1 Tax=Nonomuraea sp. NPDC000554 TaxID=3154259 RepID=UPI0033206C72
MTVPHFGTVQPADGQGQPAPILVVRSGGLPVSVLEDTAAPGASETLRAALDCEEAAAALAGPIADYLHDLIPQVDERAVRRAMIFLRREVHNGRLTAKAGRAAEQVADWLDEPTAIQVKTWLELMYRREASLSEVESRLAAELAAAGASILAALREPRIAAGLALASPAFAERLLSGTETDLADPDSRLARSAASYLARIVTKPSPFSTLTTLAATGLDGSGPATSPGREVSSSRALALTLLRALMSTPEGARLAVTANPGTRHFGGRMHTVMGVYASARGHLFRHDEVTDLGDHAWVLPALPDEPQPLSSITARLPEGLAERLLETGLLQPVTPWRMSHGLHLGALAQAVPEEAHPELRAALDSLAALEAEVAGDSDPLRRARAVERTREVAGQAFAALGRPAPSWLASASLYHESVARPADPGLPAELAADLAQAGRWIAPLIARSTVYEQMVKAFVARYGRGGTTDLFGFLYGFAAYADRSPTLPAVGQEPRGVGTVAVPSNTLFIQTVGGDASCLVVNLVQTGSGGLLGRWAGVPQLHERLGPALADWVHGLHPGCRVYQVTAFPDWAELQRPTLATLPRLRWPADLPDREGDAVDPRGMTLTHDPLSATLQAHDSDGCPVAFTYQGTMPTHLLTGPFRLLCLLSDPWLTLGRAGREPRPADPPPNLDGVVYEPRVQHGRLVWARARWRMPAGMVPRPEPGASPTAFLAEVERWRRRHRLPKEMFMSQTFSGPFGPRRDKPQWLSTDHPHLVWAALRQVRPEASAVDLVEALPDLGGHCGRDPEGTPVATELTALVRHG